MTNSGPVRELSIEIGSRLQHKTDTIVRQITEYIATRVDHLEDPGLHAMLHASVESNVTTILHLLVNDIPVEHVTAPTAAIEYAHRLSQRGVPEASLRRAYHLGSENLAIWYFDEINGLDADGETKLYLLHHLDRLTHRYIDWISRAVVDEYLRERQRWAARHTSMLNEAVAAVLNGEQDSVAEFEAATSHRAGGFNLCLIMWVADQNQGVDHIERIGLLAAKLTRFLGSREEPLVAPVDRTRARVWLSYPAIPELETGDRLRALVESHRDIRVAIGGVHRGLSGFRVTHEEAESVARLLHASTSPHSVLSIDDRQVAVVAMLARQPDELRRWTRKNLGRLASESETAGVLRETLGVFLKHQGSLAQTSEQMILHRNTVRYRIAKAEELVGGDVADRHLDLEVALAVVDLLGLAFLHESDDG